MSNRNMILPAIAGVLGMSALSHAADPTASELREQINALQAKVDKIEAQQAAATQSQATLESVFNDAEKRSQLLQAGGLTGGYDKGFWIGSADGNFKLMPFFQVQIRDVANYREDGKGSGSESIESGLELRRTRFGFKGNAFSKDFTYEFRWATNRSGGAVTLEQALVKFKIADEWSIRLGQWEDEMYHEMYVGAMRQQTVERSLTNALLGGGVSDYVQGATLMYDTGDNLHVELSLLDGINTDNTNFQDVAGNGGGLSKSNFGVETRVNYKICGKWDDYREFTAITTKEQLLVVGGGVNYTDGGESKLVQGTADVQYKAGNMPLNIYAAYLGNWLDNGSDQRYDQGAIIQVGYALDDKLELFARYDITKLDQSGSDTYNEITFGANYYFVGHNAKATIDFSYLPDGSPSDQTAVDVLASDKSEIVIRGQFQLSL